MRPYAMIVDAGCASSPGASNANRVPIVRLGVRLLVCVTVALGLATTAQAREADNAPAVRVYTKLGFTLWDADVQYAR